MPEAVFNVIMLLLAALLWAAFGVLLLWRQDYLVELWNSFRGQNLLLQGIEFIVLLPWVCALWLWNTGWLLWVRILLVLSLAWVNLYMFWPWKDR